MKLFFRTNEIDPVYISVFESILSETPEDPLYHALLLAFPNYATLLNEFAPIDPEFLLIQKKLFFTQLSQNSQLRNALYSQYEKATTSYFAVPESIDDDGMKKRAYISSLMGLMSDFDITNEDDIEKLISSSKMTLNLAGWKSGLSKNP